MIRQVNDREIRTSLIELNLSDDLLVSGKAVCFSETAPLIKINGEQYFEMIMPTVFNGVDFSEVCLYYNHNDYVYATTKNKSLEIDVRQDGLYFRAHLPDTSNSRDLYTLIDKKFIDKCSFGFAIAKDGEDFDEKTKTFIVRKIDRLFELSVVDFPAYSNTSVSARSEIETLEANRQVILKQQKQKIILKTLY